MDIEFTRPPRLEASISDPWANKTLNLSKILRELRHEDLRCSYSCFWSFIL